MADRAGFSYHAILRAIRRGELQAFEPVAGHYRLELPEAHALNSIDAELITSRVVPAAMRYDTGTRRAQARWISGSCRVVEEEGE